MTKKWNDNIFVQILYSYLRYTDRLLGVSFLLLVVILSEFYEKPRREDWVAEKSTWKNLSERYCITFLAAYPPSYVIFVVFSSILSLILLIFYLEKNFFAPENGFEDKERFLKARKDLCQRCPQPFSRFKLF